MEAKACIFDMDDTLVASAAIWKIAEHELLAALGVPWSVELASHYKGMNALDVAATIHAHLKPQISCVDCQSIMRNALIRTFMADPIRPMQGATELVRRLHGRMPLAIASGSPLSIIEHATEELGIRSCFDVLLSSESVKRGKPQPDIFLAAADQLKTPPADCLVFEDSLIGVQAARAAGMRVVCVPSMNNGDAIQPLADAVFVSLNEVPQLLP